MSVKKFTELSDADLDAITDIEAVFKAYRALRAHHIEETTALLTKLNRKRVGEALLSTLLTEDVFSSLLKAAGDALDTWPDVDPRSPQNRAYAHAARPTMIVALLARANAIDEENAELRLKLRTLVTAVQDESDRIAKDAADHEGLAVLMGSSAGSAIAGAVLLGRDIVKRLRAILSGNRTAHADPPP